MTASAIKMPPREVSVIWIMALEVKLLKMTFMSVDIEDQAKTQ